MADLSSASPQQEHSTRDVVLVRATGAVEAEVDGERILLSPSDFSYFGLTGSGANVWDLIDGQRTLGELISTLEAEFEAEDGVIGREVAEFVDALKAAGLVVEDSSPDQ